MLRADPSLGLSAWQRTRRGCGAAGRGASGTCGGETRAPIIARFGVGRAARSLVSVSRYQCVRVRRSAWRPVAAAAAPGGDATAAKHLFVPSVWNAHCLASLHATSDAFVHLYWRSHVGAAVITAQVSMSSAAAAPHLVFFEPWRAQRAEIRVLECAPRHLAPRRAALRPSPPRAHPPPPPPPPQRLGGALPLRGRLAAARAPRRARRARGAAALRRRRARAR